jgi:hypothetical protein
MVLSIMVIVFKFDKFLLNYKNKTLTLYIQYDKLFLCTTNGMKKKVSLIN